MITVSQLARICETEAGIKPGMICNRSRKAEFVEARRLFAFFAEVHKLNEKEAIEAVKLDRTSFMYLRKSAQDMYIYNKEFYATTQRAEKAINAALGIEKSEKIPASLESVEKKLDKIIKHLGIR